MNRILATAMVLSASFASQAVYAAPVHVVSTMHAAVEAKVKLVRFNVRNDSKVAMKLKAGDNEISVEPGKTTSLNLPAGTQLIAVDGGLVLATVSTALAGNTVAFH